MTSKAQNSLFFRIVNIRKSFNTVGRPTYKRTVKKYHNLTRKRKNV